LIHAGRRALIPSRRMRRKARQRKPPAIAVGRPREISELQDMGTGGITLSGFEGKVVVVTGAGRMRSIGRPLAVEFARAGCGVVITGTGRKPENYPDDEKAAGWRDIDSVA